MWWQTLPAEAWGILGALVTSVSAGVGFIVKMIADRTLATQAEATKNAANAAALTESLYTKLVEGAERREKEANARADAREETANKRMEAALAGMASLTAVVTEMSASQKLLGEEVRRANANYEALLRQR